MAGPPAEPSAGQGAALLIPGYAHILNLGEDELEEVGLVTWGCSGQTGPIRSHSATGWASGCAWVLGFNSLDGLAALPLEPSALDHNILRLADLWPGMPLSSAVSRVEGFALLVSVSPIIRALVPTLHATDLRRAAP